jgi:hypothetical protein
VGANVEIPYSRADPIKPVCRTELALNLPKAPTPPTPPGGPWGFCYRRSGAFGQVRPFVFSPESLIIVGPAVQACWPKGIRLDKVFRRVR